MMTVIQKYCTFFMRYMSMWSKISNKTQHLKMEDWKRWSDVNKYDQTSDVFELADTHTEKLTDHEIHEMAFYMTREIIEKDTLGWAGFDLNNIYLNHNLNILPRILFFQDRQQVLTFPVLPSSSCLSSRLCLSCCCRDPLRSV